MSFRCFCNVLSFNSWIKVLSRFSGDFIYEGFAPGFSKLQELSFSDSSVCLVYSIIDDDDRSVIIVEVYGKD